mgnify:CR=1 FL=1
MTDSNIELRLADSSAMVSAIVEKTVRTIYPHYYPEGAVQFFVDLHSEANIEEVMAVEEIYFVVAPVSYTHLTLPTT